MHLRYCYSAEDRFLGAFLLLLSPHLFHFFNFFKDTLHPILRYARFLANNTLGITLFLQNSVIVDIFCRLKEMGTKLIRLKISEIVPIMRD